MRILITTLLVATMVSPAYAMKALVIKNDRVLIDLEGESLKVGDRIGVRDESGKAKALIEVKQVKDGRAVAAILKGQVQKEYSLTKYTPRGKTASSSGKSGGKSKDAWGFTAGYAMNSMTVKPSGSSSISLKGSSFNLSGFYQMEVSNRISARLLGGYETLQATGSSAAASCTGSSDCKVELSYIGLEGLVRFSYLRTATLDMWVGGGLGFLFAIGKSSNVLDTSKISTNQTIVGSLGADYQLNPKHFIPIQLDYALFPDNNTSAANQIILRAGYGFNF